HVVVGALAVLGDELHRLLDLADHGLVVERVQGRELDQTEEGDDHALGELAGVEAADVLAGVAGEDVEPAPLAGAGRGLRRGGEGAAYRGEVPAGISRAPRGHTTSPLSLRRLPILAAIASAEAWARSRRVWLFHGRRLAAAMTAWSASIVRVSLPSSSA